MMEPTRSSGEFTSLMGMFMIVYQLIVFFDFILYAVNVCRQGYDAVCVCDVQRLFSSALLGFFHFCNLSRMTLDQLKALRWTDAADKTLSLLQSLTLIRRVFLLYSSVYRFINVKQ